MKHELIPLEEPERWRDALRGIDHAFGHTWENCYAMSLTTGHRTFLYQYTADDVRIVCPIAERKFNGEVDIVTPLGFSGFAGVGSSAEFPIAWRKFAQQRGWVCGYIGLNPTLNAVTRWPNDETHNRQNLYVLNLELDEKELYSNLSLNRKRQIRHFPKRDFYTESPLQIKNFIIRSSSEFYKIRNANSIYDLKIDTWLKLLNISNIEIIGVKVDQTIVAAAGFVYTPMIGDYLFNISVPEGRFASAALVWEGILRLHAKGMSTLNLGGGVSENDGVARFKERFGARKLPLTCLKQVYNIETYGALCRKFAIDPIERSSYFPPYRLHGAN